LAPGNKMRTVISATACIMKQSKLSKLTHYETTREAGRCDRVNEDWLQFIQHLYMRKLNQRITLPTFQNLTRNSKAYSG
jgi:hypothetical protein